MAADALLLIKTVSILSGLRVTQYGNVIVTVISAGLISLILTPLLDKTERITITVSISEIAGVKMLYASRFREI